MALEGNPGGGTLGGTITVPVTNGLAVFSGLTLDKAGSGYTLQATANELSMVTTSAFDVTPAPPTQLVVISQPPGTVNAGSGFGFTVAAEDPYGNVDPSFSGVVTVLLADNPGGSVLAGPTTVAANNGVASFSGLTLNRPGDGYTFLAISNGLGAAPTSPLNVVPPPTIIGEQVLIAGTGKHRRVIGFKFSFNEPVDSSRAGNAANYTVTQNVKHGRKTIAQAVRIRSVNMDSPDTVSLIVAGSPQFANGGRIVVNSTPPTRNNQRLRRVSGWQRRGHLRRQRGLHDRAQRVPSDDKLLFGSSAARKSAATA